MKISNTSIGLHTSVFIASLIGLALFIGLAQGEEFKVLATNDLGDPNHASAAVAQGKLFLVGTRNLYCLGQK